MAPDSGKIDRTTNGLLNVARTVLAELDLDVVLDRVLEAAQELTEAEYAALGVLSDDKTELARFITRGIDTHTHSGIGALPSGRGVLGVLISEPAALRVSDVGAHPRSYGFPPGHPPMHTFLGVPILVGDRPYGNLYLTEKVGGGEFSQDDEHAVMVLAEFAGVAVDHANRYTGASTQRDALARTVAALEATTQIARAVGGETDLDVILELVAKRGRALVSARSLVIELREHEELVVAATAGEVPDGLMGRRVPLEDTVASQAIRTERTQRLEEALNRARFDEHGIGRFGIGAAGGLVVPLVFRGETHGVLVAVDRIVDGPAFTPDDQRLLEAFATSAATAVAMARSIASERQRQRLAAAEAERQRWARELHDETLQSLSALRITLSTASRANREELLAQAVRQSVEHLDESIGNLRALITDLRPAALDELGVQAALEGLADRSRRRGVDVDMSIELAFEQGVATARHTAEMETAIYRLVQEALTNASKHGEAKRAVVEVREDGEAVHVNVRDDGRGFDPAAATSGFGLLGMQERVDLIGGRLDIESAPGSGTRVSIMLPVRVRSQRRAAI